MVNRSRHNESAGHGADDAMAPERARLLLYTRYYANGRDTAPYREPGTVQGQARLDAACLRLATMTVRNLCADPEALAELGEIADHQGWS